MGVSYLASAMSSKIKEMSGFIFDAMMHPGFSVVHVQSPCTEYNDTYELLKGNPKRDRAGSVEHFDDHDPEDAEAAFSIATSNGIPIGLLYKSTDRPTFDQELVSLAERANPKSVQQLIGSYAI